MRLAVMREGLVRPADRPVHRHPRGFVAHGIRRAFVEHHHDVAAEGELHIDGRCGREPVRIAVEMRLESDAFFRDLAQSRKAEHLVAAGIGQDSAGPRHEAVQSAELANYFMAGPQKEMVGVAKDDAGAQIFPQVALIQAFYRRLRADRHEDRSRDVAVLSMQNPGAGARIRAFGEKFEGDLTGQSRLYCATLDLWRLELSFRWKNIFRPSTSRIANTLTGSWSNETWGNRIIQRCRE